MKFWLPTREYKIVEDWFGGGGIRPKNLIIRLSAHIIDGPLPFALAKRLKVLVSGVHRKGSKVPKGIWVCEAKERGGLCGPCRHCWDSRIKAVSYPLH